MSNKSSDRTITLKHEVGDRVIVKDAQWYRFAKDKDGNVVKTGCLVPFTPEHAAFCGQELTITAMDLYGYQVAETQLVFADFMFDETLMDKIKKQATEANSCKAKSVKDPNAPKRKYTRHKPPKAKAPEDTTELKYGAVVIGFKTSQAGFITGVYTRHTRSGYQIQVGSTIFTVDSIKLANPSTLSEAFENAQQSAELMTLANNIAQYAMQQASQCSQRVKLTMTFTKTTATVVDKNDKVLVNINTEDSKED